MVEPATHQIRLFKSEDIQSVHRLSTRSFRLPYSPELLRSYRARARDSFLVAAVGDEIVGFVIATHPGVPLLGGRTGEIVLLAVDPDYRRRGAGGDLLQEAIALLRRRRVRNAKLHVEVTNRAAIELYKKFGFAVDHVVHGYYRDGTDAYRMVKWLD